VAVHRSGEAPTHPTQHCTTRVDPAVLRSGVLHTAGLELLDAPLLRSFAIGSCCPGTELDPRV
jgi:hypothetical protein